MAAALYYLPHSTLAGAALFLVSDVIARRREAGDLLVLGPRFSSIEPISVLFFLTAIALVGLPPLSGFVGKIFILQASIAHPAAPWLWTTILVTTLIGMIGLSRAGSILFWKSAASEEVPRPISASVTRFELLPPAALLALLGGYTLFAGPAATYMEAVSEQLFTRGAYIEAVLAGIRR
jgi:multicomponent K+:H+ antiporter subunit D